MKTTLSTVVLLALCAFTANAQTGASATAASQSQSSTTVAGRSAQASQAGMQGSAEQSSQAAGQIGKASAGTPQAVAQASAKQSADAAGQIGKTNAGAAQAGNVSAELAQKIDSKHARVGDEVVARTTSTARMSDGTKLPRGTRLVGKVTEVQAKNGAQRDGHLAFAFDHAVMRDGRQIPIHATLQSISAPASVGAMGNAGAADDEFLGGGGAMAGGGGAARAGGGGLLGGVGGAGGGAMAHTGGVVSGATSTVASSPARLEGVSDSALRSTGSVVSGTEGRGAMAVSNLPGISASGSSNGSSALDAHGKNVALSGGTQMVFSVSN